MGPVTDACTCTCKIVVVYVNSKCIRKHIAPVQARPKPVLVVLSVIPVLADSVFERRNSASRRCQP
jgi:hypothetical protein